MPSTRGAGRPSQHTLKFREKLVGKGLATDALLKKLKALQKELSELDQEKVDRSSLESIRKDLIHPTLLLHKDRGVKAYVACCIADILRLFAPDAKYTGPELQDIFEFFFRQISTGLTGADAPYYNEYYTLLESLSGVKTVVLVCDAPASEQLITTIFKEFFTIVKRDLPKKIEIFMADILVTLIDESPTLPVDVLERHLLPQFKANHAVGLLCAHCLLSFHFFFLAHEPTWIPPCCLRL
jgi:sister chromatid cohesion protein PDS5